MPRPSLRCSPALLDWPLMESAAVNAYLRHEPVIRSALRFYLDNPDDVDECVNDVFLRILTHPPLNPKASYQYILCVTRNIAFDVIRHHETVRAVPLSPLMLDESDLCAELDLLRWMERIRASLCEMGRERRYCFVARRLYGYASKEIGRRLHISENTVEQHLRNASRQIWDGTGDPPPFRTQRKPT